MQRENTSFPGRPFTFHAFSMSQSRGEIPPQHTAPTHQQQLAFHFHSLHSLNCSSFRCDCRKRVLFSFFERQQHQQRQQQWMYPAYYVLSTCFKTISTSVLSCGVLLRVSFFTFRAAVAALVGNIIMLNKNREYFNISTINRGAFILNNTSGSS